MSNQPNMPQGGYSSGNSGYGNNNQHNNQSGHGGSQPGGGYGGNQSGYGGQQGGGYGGNQPGSGYGNNQSGGNHGNNQPGGGYGGSQTSFANTPQGGGNYSNAPSGGYQKPMSQYQQEEDRKEKWKIGGGIAAGVLAAGAAAFGAKYLYDQHQEHEQQEQAQFHESKPTNYGSNNNTPLNPGEAKPVSQGYQQNDQYHQEHKQENNQYHQEHKQENNQYQQPPQYHQQQQQQQQHHNNSSYNSHKPSGALGVTPHAYPLLEHHNGEEQIKIGSKIALKHNMTGRFLATSYNAPTNNNGGSGQPLLYCSGWNAGSEEYWQVIPANGEVLVPGHPLEYGTYIRLRHVETKRQAHSHNGLKALRSSQQEATAYGGETATDNNDHWIVEKYGGGHGSWNASDVIAFRHAETGRYLHSHPEMIDNDRQEVTCGGDGRDENDKWRVCFH